MSSIAEIQRQQAVAKRAYERGEITKQEYAQFMIYSNTQKQQILNQQRRKESYKLPDESKVKGTTPSPLGATPPVAGDWKRVTPETAKTPEQKQVLQEQKQQAESMAFYYSHGKPELAEAGYAAPTIPEGYEVAAIEEKTIVKEGVYSRVPFEQKVVEVSFKEKSKPLGLAETAYTSVKVFENIFLAKVGLSENKLARSFVELGPLSQAYFATGVFGTLEADVVGTASLVTSVAESVRVGNLVYKPAWDVQLSPTVIGGAVSYAFGGEEARQLSSRPFAYQMGAVFGEGAVIVLSSEATSAVWQRLRGVKVTKIAGAKEAEVAKGTGKTLEANRVTQLLIAEERVPAGEVAKLREFSRYVNPERLALGGSQVQLAQYADDTVLLTSRSAEAFREASPYLETAAKISESKSGLLRRIAEKVGVVKSKTVFAGALTKDYTDEFAKYTSEAIGLAEKGKGFVYSAEKIVARQAVYPYGKAVASKTFTSAFVEGTIDTQVYLNLVKAVGPEVATKWYPQMGGVALQVLEKATPKTVSLTTKIIAVAAPSTVAARVAGAGVGVLPTIIKPSLKKVKTVESVKLFKEEKPKPVVIAPVTVETAQKTRKTFTTPQLVMPNLSNDLSERIDNVVVQKPEQKPSPIFDIPPGQVPITPQIIKTTPTPKTPPFDGGGRTPLVPAIPAFGGSGGGAQATGGFSVGKWFRKKNPVATWQQNLAVVAGVKSKRVKRTKKKRKRKKRGR